MLNNFDRFAENTTSGRCRISPPVVIVEPFEFTSPGGIRKTLSHLCKKWFVEIQYSF